jgi:hypothetical protein
MIASSVVPKKSDKYGLRKIFLNIFLTHSKKKRAGASDNLSLILPGQIFQTFCYSGLN